jgi:hypothetical protein
MGNLTEDEFKKLQKSDTDIFKEKLEKEEKLIEAYRNIKEILKEYCDLREDYYDIVSLWIIGTYFHEHFPSYPYLYFNAMKGSGKTRALKLITHLSKDGSMLNSLTEAVLFRTKGTLAIDEFEGLGRRGAENLRELLNSAYKKGIKVKRMRKARTEKGEQQVVEEFDVYRPILIANIWGMETVLGDRCLTLILEKSNKPQITNLIELFEHDERIQKTKELCNSFLVKTDESVSLVSMSFLVGMYKEWNKFVKYNDTNYTNNINNINDTNSTQLFRTLKSSSINGRELELTFPILLVSWLVGEIETTLNSVLLILSERREEDLVENSDISLIDYISNLPDNNEYWTIKKLTNMFKEALQSDEDWLNERWLGRALKRLNLVKQKRRQHKGREVILNIQKAKEKIRMFK